MLKDKNILRLDKLKILTRFFLCNTAVPLFFCLVAIIAITLGVSVVGLFFFFSACSIFFYVFWTVVIIPSIFVVLFFCVVFFYAIWATLVFYLACLFFFCAIFFSVIWSRAAPYLPKQVSWLSFIDWLEQFCRGKFLMFLMIYLVARFSAFPQIVYRWICIKRILWSAWIFLFIGGGVINIYKQFATIYRYLIKVFIVLSYNKYFYKISINRSKLLIGLTSFFVYATSLRHLIANFNFRIFLMFREFRLNPPWSKILWFKKENLRLLDTSVLYFWVYYDLMIIKFVSFLILFFNVNVTFVLSLLILSYFLIFNAEALVFTEIFFLLQLGLSKLLLLPFTGFILLLDWLRSFNLWDMFFVAPHLFFFFEDVIKSEKYNMFVIFTNYLIAWPYALVYGWEWVFYIFKSLHASIEVYFFNFLVIQDYMPGNVVDSFSSIATLPHEVSSIAPIPIFEQYFLTGLQLITDINLSTYSLFLDVLFFLIFLKIEFVFTALNILGTGIIGYTAGIPANFFFLTLILQNLIDTIIFYGSWGLEVAFWSFYAQIMILQALYCDLIIVNYVYINFLGCTTLKYLLLFCDKFGPTILLLVCWVHYLLTTGFQIVSAGFCLIISHWQVGVYALLSNFTTLLSIICLYVLGALFFILVLLPFKVILIPVGVTTGFINFCLDSAVWPFVIDIVIFLFELLFGFFYLAVDSIICSTVLGFLCLDVFEHYFTVIWAQYSLGGFVCYYTLFLFFTYYYSSGRRFLPYWTQMFLGVPVLSEVLFTCLQLNMHKFWGLGSTRNSVFYKLNYFQFFSFNTILKLCALSDKLLLSDIKFPTSFGQGANVIATRFVGFEFETSFNWSWWLGYNSLYYYFNFLLWKMQNWLIEGSFSDCRVWLTKIWHLNEYKGFFSWLVRAKIFLEQTAVEFFNYLVRGYLYIFDFFFWIFVWKPDTGWFKFWTFTEKWVGSNGIFCTPTFFLLMGFDSLHWIGGHSHMYSWNMEGSARILSPRVGSTITSHSNSLSSALINTNLRFNSTQFSAKTLISRYFYRFEGRSTFVNRFGKKEIRSPGLFYQNIGITGLLLHSRFELVGHFNISRIWLNWFYERAVYPSFSFGRGPWWDAMYLYALKLFFGKIFSSWYLYAITTISTFTFTYGLLCVLVSYPVGWVHLILCTAFDDGDLVRQFKKRGTRYDWISNFQAELRLIRQLGYGGVLRIENYSTLKAYSDTLPPHQLSEFDTMKHWYQNPFVLWHDYYTQQWRAASLLNHKSKRDWNKGLVKPKSLYFTNIFKTFELLPDLVTIDPIFNDDALLRIIINSPARVGTLTRVSLESRGWRRRYIQRHGYKLKENVKYSVYLPDKVTNEEFLASEKQVYSRTMAFQNKIFIRKNNFFLSQLRFWPDRTNESVLAVGVWDFKFLPYDRFFNYFYYKYWSAKQSFWGEIFYLEKFRFLRKLKRKIPKRYSIRRLAKREQYANTLFFRFNIYSHDRQNLRLSLFFYDLQLKSAKILEPLIQSLTDGEILDGWLAGEMYYRWAVASYFLNITDSPIIERGINILEVFYFNVLRGVWVFSSFLLNVSVSWISPVLSVLDLDALLINAKDLFSSVPVVKEDNFFMLVSHANGNGGFFFLKNSECSVTQLEKVVELENVAELEESDWVQLYLDDCDYYLLEEWERGLYYAEDLGFYTHDGEDFSYFSTYTFNNRDLWHFNESANQADDWVVGYTSSREIIFRKDEEAREKALWEANPTAQWILVPRRDWVVTMNNNWKITFWP